MKFYTISLFLCSFFISCDPGMVEEIIITNESGKSLHLNAALNANQIGIYDSLLFIIPNKKLDVSVNYDSLHSILSIDYIIPSGQSCFLHQLEAIGSPFSTIDNGMDIIQTHFDSLIMIDPKLKKSIYDKSNWKVQNSSGFMHSETYMVMIISPKDIE